MEATRRAGRARGRVLGAVGLAVALRGGIYENGAFHTVPRTSPDQPVPGQTRMLDGGVVYDSATSAGKLTLHGTGTGWVWTWQGTTGRGARAVTTELTRSE